MQKFVNKYFSGSDDALIKVALGGEKVSAYLRLIILGLLWLGSLILTLFLDEIPFELKVGIGAGSIAFMSSVFVLYLAYNPNQYSYRHFLICAFDVSLVSFTLLFFALVNKPGVAINSMVVWEIYLIFIASTCVYYDTRICLTTGLLAFFQYLILLIWVTSTWDMTTYSNADSNLYTGFSWYVQIARLSLIFITTLIAIGIVYRSRKILNLASTDALTGLHNRRILEARLTEEISRAQRESSNLCIAYIDIDHFKEFNDLWGHTSGDQALQIFASTLNENVRAHDSVARWGGEEFVILFPKTTLSDAFALLTRINDILENTQLSIKDKAYRLHFSAGISQYSDDGNHATELIDMADTRLKIAKEHGRNKVIISS